MLLSLQKKKKKKNSAHYAHPVWKWKLSITRMLSISIMPRPVCSLDACAYYVHAKNMRFSSRHWISLSSD
jgi:hypothetical protein